MDKQQIYDRLLGWLTHFGPRIIIAIIALLAGLKLVSWVQKLSTSYFNKSSLDRSLKPFLSGIITAVLYILLFILITQILGLQMTMFAAIVGGLGVAGGLALSGTLQNFASGIMILVLKPFKVGENIMAQGNEGTVTSIRIFNTVITTFNNIAVIIPNSKLSNEVIVNLSRCGNRRLDIELKFNYGMDFDLIRHTIQQSLAETTAQLQKEDTRIGISSLENDGYKVVINTWLPAHEFYDNKFLLQEHLLRNFKSSGLKLPGML